MGVNRKLTNENGALKGVLGIMNGNIGQQGMNQLEGMDTVDVGTGT